jgi:hypothetical protein
VIDRVTFPPTRSFSPHVRANHANRPQTEAACGRRSGGRRPGRLTLVAGGAVLAHVWGLGLGLAEAHAASGEPSSGLVSQSGAGGLLDQVTGAAAPALEHPARPVETVLQEQIRAGGLPLPGQATSLPDAFAIATVLLPTVPPQPRADGSARASRSGAGHTGMRPSGAVTIPEQRSPGSAATGDRAATAQHQLPALVTDSAELGTLGTSPEDSLGLTAAAPARTDDQDTAVAVLAPIAAGLLLTGAAMYKHRGLPSGH